ncbi:hypothetical protein GCM10023069_23970 [Shinella granuli]
MTAAITGREFAACRDRRFRHSHTQHRQDRPRSACPGHDRRKARLRQTEGLGKIEERTDAALHLLDVVLRDIGKPVVQEGIGETLERDGKVILRPVTPGSRAKTGSTSCR